MNHTLVIPTYNRSALLRRLVQHYCSGSQKMNLLVLDSSRSEVAAENARALSFASESVRHVTFPETISTVSKLSAGLDLVRTPYVSLSADDDLVFHSGLQEAIVFLDAHPDYVCAHGLYLNFRQEGRDVLLAREYAGPSIEAAHPGARIFRLLQKYESLYYATFRTPDLREAFSAARALPTLVFQELFQSVAALIKGKVRRFPALYAARQSGPPAQPERENWQTYYWFAKDPAEVMEHYRMYREKIWEFYSAHAARPLLERAPFFRSLDLAHAVYFSAGCPPEYFYSVVQPLWPQDAYHDVAGVNLFAGLGPASRSGRTDFARALSLLPHFLRAVWSTPWVVFLNGAVRMRCRTSWKCRLPIRLRSLATLPDFRKQYIELCHYLDQP